MNAQVTSATTLIEAVDALRDATPETRVLAGGTDLMVEFETGRTRPDHIVDIWRVDELRGIAVERDGLRIGALTHCNELIHSDLVRTRADILAAAADEVGAEQIKNRATIGGNLGTASPAADLNPVLVALDADVHLVSATGRRVVPARSFLTGYRTSDRRPDELIEAVWIPPRPDHERRAFRKVGTRRAQSISKVVLAIAWVMDGERVSSLRAAVGSVAERTLELPSLADELVGHPLEPARIASACRRAVMEDARPIDDVRSSGVYRRNVLFRILRTTLTSTQA